MPISTYILVTMLGLVVGSFLNVVIYRLPRILKERYEAECRDYLQITTPSPTPAFQAIGLFNLAFPRSHCPHCNATIPIWHNIPIFSYCFLKGRCRQCHQGIHWRYPAIECLSGLLTLLVFIKFGFQPITLAFFLLTWDLIAVTAIDLEHLLIPDELSLPFLWLGLLINLQYEIISLSDAVLGAALGYMSLWSIYWIFKLITKKEGMGYGDFKLAALLGAWLGWQQLPFIIFLSAFLGLLFGLYFIVVKNRSKDIPFAFGPFLAIAGWIAMYFGNQWLLAISM